MKKKHVLAFLLAAVLLLSLLSGCTGSAKPETPATDTQEIPTEAKPETPETPETSPEETPSEEAPSAGPRVVTDILGRQVELPDEITEVAALGSAARMMTYAGCAGKIVGLSDLEKTADVGTPFAYANREQFAQCASISSGGSGDTVYAEELVVLDPDIIFYFGADADTLDDLQNQVGIPVIGLYADNFYDSNFFATLRLIGQVMGNEAHVEEVVTAIQDWIEDLDARTRDIPDADKPTVYTGALGFRGAHGFEGTSGQFPPFVAVHANNVVDETGETGTLLIDLEKVTQWDPEYIFLNPSSMYLVNEDYATNTAFYENLSAVQNGNLYSMVSYNYYWSNQEIAIVDAYYVGTIIYPEQFADVDFESKAEEIFNVMLGTDYLSQLAEAGIGYGQLTIGE